MNCRHAAIIVRRSADAAEALRSAVGLGMENIFVTVLLIDASLNQAGSADRPHEYVEMIDDLEGTVFSNVRADVDANPLINFLDLTEGSGLLSQQDLIINM